MTTDDPKSIRRAVMKVPSTGQMRLFDQPSSSGVRHQTSSTNAALKFVDPDPKALVFGDGTLQSYLESAGLQSAFLIRNVFNTLDFSAFEASYKAGGRPPYSPRRIASLIIYAITQGVTSLRQIEGLARRDLVAIWLTGGFIPDHSTLGRFIQQHEEQLQTSLFESMTSLVLGCLPETSLDVSGDGTVVEAAVSRFVHIKKEAAKQLAEEARKSSEDDPDDPKKRQQLEQAERCVEAIKEREEARKKNKEKVTINPHDPDAVLLKHKRGTFAYGYVPSVITNQHRVILGLSVHPTNENASVEAMLEQTERTLGTAPETLSLDGNYFSFDIVKMAHDLQIELLCPPKGTKASTKAKHFRKSEFVFDSETQTYRCPANKIMEGRPIYFDKASGKYFQDFHTNECKNCPLRSQCTSAKGDGRRVRRWEDEALTDELRERMKQPEAQQTYSHRLGSVEPVFGEIRHIQKLDRFRRTGLKSVLTEFALHAIAHNLRRLWVTIINGLLFAFLGLLSGLLRRFKLLKTYLPSDGELRLQMA